MVVTGLWVGLVFLLIFSIFCSYKSFSLLNVDIFESLKYLIGSYLALSFIYFIIFEVISILMELKIDWIENAISISVRILSAVLTSILFSRILYLFINRKRNKSDAIEYKKNKWVLFVILIIVIYYLLQSTQFVLTKNGFQMLNTFNLGIKILTIIHLRSIIKK